MLARTIKPLLFFFGLMTNPIAAANSNKAGSLPLECSDLTLVKGDPNFAKTVIYGDDHYAKHCHSSYVKCSSALSKGIAKKDIIALQEAVPHDQFFACDTTGAHVSFVAGTCKGWNEPATQKVERNKIPLEVEAMGDVLLFVDKNILSLLKLPAKEQSPLLKKALQAVIDTTKSLIKKNNDAHAKEFSQFKKTQPQIKITEFYSEHLSLDQRYTIFLNHIEDIRKKVDLGIPLDEIIYKINKDFNRKLIDPRKFLNVEYFKTTNRYLLSSIRRSFPDKKKVFAVAGDKHVNKKHGTSAEAAIVQDLYDELDKFADQNPYAILSCSVKD